MDIADGGSGGIYDWAAGPWSAQVDFAFPTTPKWGAVDHFVLVSKGSFNRGTGWEVQINNSAFQGKYQIELLSNHGLDSYSLVTGYQVVPGAFNRAMFICDGGLGTWYVNGSASNSQPCVAPASGATNLLVGRYSDTPDFATNLPIARVQIWNRALTSPPSGSRCCASTASSMIGTTPGNISRPIPGASRT